MKYQGEFSSYALRSVRCSSQFHCNESHILYPKKTGTEEVHRAYGKLILFGEHFVVYDLPAVVAAVDAYTLCSIRALTMASQSSSPCPAESQTHRDAFILDIIDDRPAVKGYKREKVSEQMNAHVLMLHHLFRFQFEQNSPTRTNSSSRYLDIFWKTSAVNFPIDGCDSNHSCVHHKYRKVIKLVVHLSGNLVPTSGIGASAADCVCFARAMNELYGMRMTEEEINYCAYQGERGYHGNPSGIDNTISTYGGIILFSKGQKNGVQSRDEMMSNDKFRPAVIKHEFSGAMSVQVKTSSREPLFLHMLAVCTGIVASTKKVVADVRKFAKENPEQFKQILNEYKALFFQAKSAIWSGNVSLIGRLMYQNHCLLQQIGVSSVELDEIVRFTFSMPFVNGAKLSGTGRGGIAMIFCDNAKSQQFLKSCFENPKDDTFISFTSNEKAKIPKVKHAWQYTLSIKTQDNRESPTLVLAKL